MPAYSRKSKAKLWTCHTDIQCVFEHIILGYDNTVLCGIRPKGEQDEAYRTGNSKVEWPNSEHNVADENGNEIPEGVSKAIDAAPYHADLPHIRWDNSRNTIESFKHFAGFVEGVSQSLDVPLRWGGDWNRNHVLNDQSFFDLVHWELLKDHKQVWTREAECWVKI